MTKMVGRKPLLVAAFLAIAACGREGPLLRAEPTASLESSIPPATAEPSASATPTPTPGFPRWERIFSSGLSVTLTLDKASYAYDEEVSETIQVVNVTSRPIVLENGGCLGHLRIVKLHPELQADRFDESYTWWGGDNDQGQENVEGARQGTAGNWLLTFEPGVVHTRTLRWDQLRDQRCDPPNCNETYTPPRGTGAPPGTYHALAYLAGQVCPEGAADGQRCDQAERYAYADRCPQKNEDGICVPRLEFRIIDAGVRPDTPRSGIFGSMTHGPVCTPGETGCEGRPLRVPVYAHANGPVSEDRQDTYQANPDENGKFRLALPPGSYTVGGSSRSFPRCSVETVEVTDGAYTPAHLTCDAGDPTPQR